jgi:FkbH-like protein
VRDFRSIRKNLAKDYSGFPQVRVAVLTDMAPQYLSQALRAAAFDYQWDLQAYEGAIGHMEADALDPGSGLFAFSPDVVLVVPTAEAYAQRFRQAPPDGRPDMARSEADRLLRVVQALRQTGEVSVLVATLCDIDDGLVGQYATRWPSSLRHSVRNLNALIAGEVTAQPGVFPVDVAALGAQVGRDQFFDDRSWYLTSNPFTMDFMAAIAESCLSVIEVLRGRVRKCLVTDLDNTIWGGVVGEVGVTGIAIGHSGVGAAFADVQAWMRDLSRRGVILCVCSKNDEKVAKEPFLSHPEMVLRLEDIAVFKANWIDKAQNLREVAATLNIGLDSVVFLDDSPFEREQVRQALPEVAVPELPDEPTQVPGFLRSLNLFEAIAVSAEDAARTTMYRQEAAREQARSRASDIDSYLSSLGMRCAVAPFDEYSIPRVAQLTQRTNQFNLRTQRYTETQVAALAASPDCVTMAATLCDTFGNYGIIGAIILRRVADNSMLLDTFLMSCRVAKRGVEAFLFNKIAALARDLGCSTVQVEYLPTAKNGVIRSLPAELGLLPMTGPFDAPAGSERWALVPDDYRPQKTFVEEQS